MKSVYIVFLGLFLSTSLISQISYDTTYSKEWNEETKLWESFDRVITSYDEGLVSSELIQVSENDKWLNYNFKAYYYNNGRLIEEFEQYWNDAKLKWEDNYRKLYKYDNEGRLIQITHQNILKGKYINTSQEILIYSSDGQLKEKIIQNFEEAWTNFLKYQYYYNADDLLTDENLAYWDKNDWTRVNFSINILTIQ